MNSRETQEASGKSQEPKRTLAKRIADIIPSSITKWFKNLQSSEQSSPEQSSPDSGCLGEPEPKRRRLSEDTNKYLPTTACATSNTYSLYSPRLTQKRKSEDLLNATTNKSPEDAVNRVSFILKSSKDDPKTKETYVDHNRTPGSPFYPGNTTYGGASNHLSQYAIRKRSTSGNRLNKSRRNNDFKLSGPSKRIRNLFENYSSPLEEVRRISQFVSNENNNNLSNDTSQHIATRSQELHVPSIADILSLKKKPGLMASTSTARQLLASQSSATKYSPYGVYKNSDSVKQRLHNSNRKETCASTSSLPTTSTPNSSKINTGSLNNITLITSTAKATNNSQSPNNIEDMEAETSSFQLLTGADVRTKTTESDCRVTVDSSNTNIDPNMTDKCDDEENVTEDDPWVPNRLNSLKWKCEVCWIENDIIISKCVCCGTKKPLKESDNDTTRPADNITCAKFNNSKQVSNSQNENWNCQVCLVKNDKLNSKCICCDVDKPCMKKSALTFNFCVPSTSQFKFGINLGNTTQQPTKDMEKKVSFGLAPTNSVGVGLGKNIGESNERNIILEEERVAEQQVTKVPSALPIAGHGRITCNFNMLSPVEEVLNECSSLGNTSNTQNLSSQNNTAQHNDSNIAGTLGASSFTTVPPYCTSVPPSSTLVPPSVTPGPSSVTPGPENRLTESKLNSIPPEQLNFGSSVSQNPISIGPMKMMKFKNFINNKINSTSVLHLGGGKCESPTINSLGKINSAAGTSIGNIILSGNDGTHSRNTDSSNRFSNVQPSPSHVRSNDGSPSLNTGNSNRFSNVQPSPSHVRSNDGSPSLNTGNSNLFSNVQPIPSPPQPIGGFRDQSRTENSSWASTNSSSASQDLRRNQQNQATPLFTFGGMSSESTSMNSVPNFGKNAHMPSPSQAFGMLPANANNSFNSVVSGYFDNHAKSLSNMNTVPGAAEMVFGQTPQYLAQNNSLFVEPSHQMALQPNFNFSAGQNSPSGVFNFSQQSGVRSMTGSSLPQFQVGSSSAPGQARRIRKAVRRTTPR